MTEHGLKRSFDKENTAEENLFKVYFMLHRFMWKYRDVLDHSTLYLVHKTAACVFCLSILFFVPFAAVSCNLSEKACRYHCVVNTSCFGDVWESQI